MSTETHVFFRGKLPSKAALSRAMKELGFPFSIKPASGALETQSGFMPMMFRREETGVEFDVFGDHAAVEDFADAGVDQSFERRASMRWGSDFQEAVAGMCAAAALARLVNGDVFDEAEDKLLGVDEAIALARRNLDALAPPPKRRPPRGLGPLKRMLAPLLAKRSDLVLVDRLLLIRPVRHLVRGAIFRRDKEGSIWSVGPYLRPLYQPSELFMESTIFSESIENSDFAAMLFDQLATEIFEPLGKITTIEDFIESSWGKRVWPIYLYHSVLLARGIEGAKALVASFDPERTKWLADCQARLAAANRKNRDEMYHRKAELKEAEEDVALAQRRQAFLARGEAEVFAHYRDWEKKVAEGYKLQQVWEQSPFPAELPSARRGQSSDPVFKPTPWLEFPDTWRQEPPAVPGEMRFGRDWWCRNGQVSLLHPISAEDAHESHRNLQSYILATRLPQNQLVILRFHGSSTPDREDRIYYNMRVYDPTRRDLVAHFQESYEEPGAMKLTSVDIAGSDSNDCGWLSQLDFKDGAVTIRDYRTGETGYERRKMTDADRAMYVFPVPDFGDVETLWQRVSLHLAAEGLKGFA